MRLRKNQNVRFLSRAGYRESGQVVETIQVEVDGSKREMLRIRADRTGEIIVRLPDDVRTGRAHRPRGWGNRVR